MYIHRISKKIETYIDKSHLACILVQAFPKCCAALTSRRCLWSCPAAAMPQRLVLAPAGAPVAPPAAWANKANPRAGGWMEM